MKTQFGFTLIELLVVIAVVAVLATVAVPQLEHMVTNNRTVSHYNSLITSLNLARAEAVKRNEQIRLCAGSTAACTTTTWENGWVILTEDDTVLQAVDPLNGTYTLRLTQSASTDSLLYRPNGILRDTSGTFVLCDKTGQATRARAVNVNRMGRPSRAKDTDATADDIVNDVTGSNVTCP